MQVTRVLQDFYDADPKRGFWGGGGIDVRFGQSPARFGLDGLPPDLPRWGAEWRKAVSFYFPRMMRLASHITCLPMEQNSIEI